MLNLRYGVDHNHFLLVNVTPSVKSTFMSASMWGAQNAWAHNSTPPRRVSVHLVQMAHSFQMPPAWSWVSVWSLASKVRNLLLLTYVFATLPSTGECDLLYPFDWNEPFAMQRVPIEELTRSRCGRPLKWPGSFIQGMNNTTKNPTFANSVNFKWISLNKASCIKRLQCVDYNY